MLRSSSARRQTGAAAPARGAGTRPMFGTFILKLTGFCNLDCSYCYMFNSLDRTFERKPRSMSADTAEATLHAIGEHLEATGQKRGAVVLHGGEPTLWPAASFHRFFAALERLRGRGLEIDCGVQTNALKLPSKPVLDLFAQHGVRLGISIDGPPAINDAHRVDFAGHGSYARILRNVDTLRAGGYEDLLGGFLCVIQPEISPAAFLEWITTLPVTRVDLLWPLEYNQYNPPWGEGSEQDYAAAPRYGEWLAEVFEAWWKLDRPEIFIRAFRYAIEARVGGIHETDSLGPRGFHSVVVNTDGDIELTDYFRSAVDGGTFTGHSVLKHDFADVARDARFLQLKQAAERTPKPCRSCRHRSICAGGTLAGRLDAKGQVTAGPSVLCHDHMRYFDTLADRVDAALAAERQV